MNENLAEAIKRKAHDLGFDLVGITGAEPSVFAAEYREWIERGCHGEMGYLARNVDRRLDPQQVLQGAKSIVVVGMNYYAEEDAPASAQGSHGDTANAPYTKTQRHKEEQLTTESVAKSTVQDRAIFARYASGDDYHDVMTPRLRQLLAFIQEARPFTSPGGSVATEGRVYVDTGPILEREVARRAGLGWFGKNTMLINTRRGSYFLLGEIVTNLALPVDEPAVGGCGTCTRCIDACPTGAITAPYALDARRCISYLTIELKGPIPEELAPAIGNRIFGCDICQEVCPFNRPAGASHPTLVPTTEPAFQPRAATTGRTVEELALLSEEEFREQFRGSAVKRAKWRGLLRNVAAAASSRQEDANSIAASAQVARP
jgi:epoxyqueuosine reductase